MNNIFHLWDVFVADSFCFNLKVMSTKSISSGHSYKHEEEHIFRSY